MGKKSKWLDAREPGNHTQPGASIPTAMSASYLRAALLPALVLLGSPAAEAVQAGQALGGALEELIRSGAQLVYSSALIDPTFTVKADPGRGPPLEIARRILAPYGLTLTSIQGQAYSITRQPVTHAPKPAVVASLPLQAAAQPVPAPRDEIDVYASRYAVQPLTVKPTVELSQQDIEALPGLEQDALRAVRYAPGIASNTASARMHVRGGRENEVAVYFDGVPLFEPYHYKDAQALLSILDPQTVSRLDLLSGAFPARYGNRLSGVVEMEPRDASQGSYNAVGMSLLYSQIISSGKMPSLPVQWLSVVRRGNVDLVQEAMDQDHSEPAFLDALGRVQVDLGDRSSVAIGYLMLNDDLDARLDRGLELQPNDQQTGTPVERAHIRYRDATGWLGWTFRPAESDEIHLSVSRTQRHTDRDGTLDRTGSATGSLSDGRRFSTETARLEASMRVNEYLSLNSGGEWYDYAAHYAYDSQASFEPVLAKTFARVAGATSFNQGFGGQAYAGYASALISALSRLSFDVGMRWDAQRFGRAFSSDQLSPRLGARYQLDSLTLLRLSWGRAAQTQRPDELDVPEGESVFHRPEYAKQWVIGMDRQLTSQWQLRLEGFDKRISNPLPEYENLVDPFTLLPQLEVDRVRLQPDSSRIDGAEMTLRWQNAGPWSAWMNYSWSQATDRFGPVTVPRTWDQKHSVAGGIAWRKAAWSVSADANWHTGWRRTELSLENGPVGPVVTMGGLNAARWPDYFSLNLRSAWVHSLWRGTLQLYAESNNVLNNANRCCSSYSISSTGQLESGTYGWQPRFVLVGATWQLP